MLNTQHFIQDDKTGIINQIYSSPKNVAAGFAGYCITHPKSQSSFAATLKKTQQSVWEHNSTWNWKVSCSSRLYLYHIKCFVIRNNQVVTKKITSLPGEVGGRHSSFNATRYKQRNSNGQQLQFFTVRPHVSVKLNRLHFHIDIFLAITPPNSAAISTQLCVTSLQKEKKTQHMYKLLKKTLSLMSSLCFGGDQEWEQEGRLSVSGEEKLLHEKILVVLLKRNYSAFVDQLFCRAHALPTTINHHVFIRGKKKIIPKLISLQTSKFANTTSQHVLKETN